MGSASAAHRPDILFGAEKGVSYNEASADTPNLTVQRIYSTASDPIPASWPAPPPGVKGIYSFKPDLIALDAGQLDAQIVASLRALPVGSWVTLWHEANIRAGMNQGDYTHAIRRVAWLVRSRGIPVVFGQIFATRLSQDLKPWVVPGLGFYAEDGYGHHNDPARTPESLFGPEFAAIQSVSPGATLAITETDVVNGTTAETDAWAKAAFHYACTNDFGALVLWSLPGTTINLPDAATVAYIAKRAAVGAC